MLLLAVGTASIKNLKLKIRDSLLFKIKIPFNHYEYFVVTMFITPDFLMSEHNNLL